MKRVKQWKHQSVGKKISPVLEDEDGNEGMQAEMKGEEAERGGRGRGGRGEGGGGGGEGVNTKIKGKKRTKRRRKWGCRCFYC